MVVHTSLVSKTLKLRGGFVNSFDIQKTEKLFEFSAKVVNAAGGSLLVIACIAAIIDTIRLKYLKFRGKASHLSLDKIRVDLGELICYSLELLVAADVIETLTAPAHSYHIDTLYKIGIIVAIRTVLSYFLGKEVEELELKLESKAASKK